jgi:hypothetical protein
LTTFIKTMFKVYLVPNLLVQVIPKCMLQWIALILWSPLMQVIGLQLVVARRWDDLQFSNWHNNTLTNGRLTSCFSSTLFSSLLMPLHLGMDEFIVFF